MPIYRLSVFERSLRLTTHTDFAIRTLMYLATQDRRATASEVAQLYGVSGNHLAKCVNLLSRLGFVRSVRGMGGGIELARRPEEIQLGDAIEALEGNMHLLDCVATDDVCVIQRFCKLKTVLADAEREQLNYLNQFTLADVAPTRRQLSRIEAT